MALVICRMTIENAHVEEKAAAIEALGDVAENCTYVRLHGEGSRDTDHYPFLGLLYGLI